MEKKKTASKGGLVTCGIFLACYVFFNYILIKFVHNNYYQVILYIILGIAGIAISKEELKEANASWKAHPVRNILLVIGGYFAMILIDNIAVIPFALLFPDGGGINDSNIAAASQEINPVLFIAALGVFGPITEETVFRTILTKRAGEFIPKAAAVIISSVLFGMIHMHAFTLVEMLFVLPQLFTGVLFAILLLKTKNIYLVYILHVLNNVLPLMIYLLQG